MKTARRLFNIFLTLLLSNLYILSKLISLPYTAVILTYAVLFLLFIIISIFPSFSKSFTIRLKIMRDGYELILLFGLTYLINIALYIYYGINFLPHTLNPAPFAICAFVALIIEGVIILNGILRVYFTSVQLGVSFRIVFALLWWTPILNIVFIIIIYKTVRSEYAEETEKIELNNTRKENEICKTKYPILLVHGVFFRDIRYINYWGRIPKELTKNGATLYYGEQQSALSVRDSAKELAQRIEKIVKDTGCEKLNIIAHSKGGLDARYAIGCLGADKNVASLTTINTPHHGCGFAEYLLKIAPVKFRNYIAKKYNNSLKKLGDTNPDFLGAVNDLTVGACKKLNRTVPDVKGVYYQSVASVLKRPQGGKFPLNLTYRFVRFFDGENDGLVSSESAKWGEKYILLKPKGKRGISHGDIIDLNRKNIKGFDVREFYVELVKDLKEKSF